MLELDRNYVGDAREVLRKIDSGSIDLVVTSPPYDNMRHYDNRQGHTWNSSMFEEIAGELHRVMKDGGTVVWVVNDKTEGGGKTLTSLRQALYFQEVGFVCNDVMIWQKKNPMPVLRSSRYTDVFEYMFVFVKGKKPRVFNPMMIPCKCGGQAYNSTAKLTGGERGRKALNYEVNQEKVAGNIWEIAVAQNKTGHPAVYPQELVEKHISSWSNAGDIVLDPFMGSGTTALAALKLDRHFIGIDISEDYVAMTDRRIQEYLEKC